ncbi:MAG: iron-sulfur cluster-binding domain-containing protein [Bacteroidota bacterium]
MIQIWKTEKVIQETLDTKTIVFNPGSESFTYKAGQFINLSTKINGVMESRSYSLSSSPGETFPAVTVKRIGGGLVSNYIHEYADTITEWTIEGPQGLFHIPDESSTQYAFIAGGSGITPIYSMVNDVLRNSAAEIFLLYTSKHIESKIFHSNLQQLEQQYTERLRIQYVLTSEQGQSTPSTSHVLGRLNRLMLKKILKGHLGEKMNECELFVCGPPGLISLSEEVFSTLQIDPIKIHKEYFQPPVIEVPTIKIQESILEVLLHVREQTNLLSVQPGTSILDSALEDKIDMAYSCKSGTCGKCVGKLLAGKIHMHHNYALTEDQLHQGYILLCQSIPLNELVEIEVG